MKLAFVIALAGLAFVGSAVAQPGSDHSSGVTSPPDSGPWPAPPPIQSRVLQQIRQADAQLNLACAADRARLCADKKSGIAATRCIGYHWLKLSKPCQHAIDQAQLAREGAL